MTTRELREHMSNIRLLYLVCTLALLIAGCNDEGASPAGTAESTPLNNGASEATSEPPSVTIRFGERASATLSGEAVANASAGGIEWIVPSEAVFDVSFPYEGDPPDAAMLQLVMLTPRGETELASIAVDPVIENGVLSYDRPLAILSRLDGHQKCIIRTVGLFDGESKSLHDGDVEIDFSASQSATP